MHFQQLPLGVRIKSVIAELIGYQHPWAHRTHVRFPRRFGPISGNLVDPSHKFIDCSSMTTYVVMRVYPEVPWDMQDYEDLQTFADRLPRRPFASIEALERRGVGSRVLDPRTAPSGVWFVIQGWRRLGDALGDAPSGHAMLGESLGGGRVRIWESTIKSPDGPRHYETKFNDLDDDYVAGTMYGALGPGMFEP